MIPGEARRKLVERCRNFGFRIFDLLRLVENDTKPAGLLEESETAFLRFQNLVMREGEAGGAVKREKICKRS
jgi:hypothetical protein